MRRVSRMSHCARRWWVGCVLGCVMTTAHAGLFDDSEARMQIAELKKQVLAAQEAQSRGQLELMNQLQRQADEMAGLRGMIETLTNRQDMADKRLKDLYLDLDTRVRNVETRGGAVAAAGDPGAPAPAKPVDPAVEMKSYETALGLLRANKLKEAITGFEGFQKDYPNSNLAPNAQFWMGNAWSALGNCKKAIELLSQGVSRWPQSSKTPDMLLSLSTCQKDSGQNADAKKSLETIVSKYPDSPAAETARQRLGKK